MANTDKSSTMRVPVKMEYELGELTEERLREMGARCVGETLDIEYYYDTESFQLASTQTWLNQHEGQWGLILAQKQDINPSVSEETKMSEEEQKSNMADSSSQKREQPGFHPEKRNTADSENLTSKSKVQSTSSDDISVGSAYTELNDPCSIMMHITKCLQLPLTHAEVQDMTMKNFLRTAQIKIYDSWMGSRSVKYSLPGGFMLALDRNYRTPTVASSVFLSMDADVLNISTDLERMDRLHKDLGLKPKASLHS
ncbi:hypothetical protein IRJ41_019552 [Triplophysa rosa]|uniref:Uncharacterized protein n=1 Tax=Triplophysa rosa TaxID=992332 RepID=A0A9W7TFE7_TRIRA|nr:hypothetical protein IRJ41_019552 [Triplophysa rosa]